MQPAPMLLRRRSIACVLVTALCTGTAAANDDTAARELRHDAAQRLRVMSFNILYGGDDYDLASGGFCAEPDACGETLVRVIDVIRAARADVVGLQEPERNTARIARALGWYASPRAHVISRFPIIDPPGAEGRYVFLETAPGRVVAVGNVHLPSDPYGPYAVRDGAALDAVLELENTTRLPAIVEPIRVFRGLAARRIPAFLTGDFNSPSHRDWTVAVTSTRPEVPYAIDWPVGRALANAGIVDSFRAVHPDPVLNPGFTWTPGGPEAATDEVFDRIDWVLGTGPMRAIASTVVGEPGAVDARITVPAPYPSDHRAVLSVFDAWPAPMPVLIAVSERALDRGAPLLLTYRGEGRRGETVVFRRQAGQPAPGAIVHRVRVPHADDGAPHGRIRTTTAPLPPGAYDVQLRSSSGRVLATTPLWIYRPGAAPTLATDAAQYAVGAPIRVSFTRAPGMALDWVSIFRCDDAGCAEPSAFLVYAYTGNAIEGRVVIDAGATAGSEAWPLPPGRYVARLLADDGYRPVAETRVFEIGAFQEPE